MAGGEVAFNNKHVVEDLVGLGQKLDDGCNTIPIIHALGPIRVGECGIANC
jgi:hypothetical protein